MLVGALANLMMLASLLPVRVMLAFGFIGVGSLSLEAAMA